MEFQHFRTDAMLMEILVERKTVTGFLDTIFGFLRRNTDFYHVKKDNADKLGFAKGVREQILFGAMQRYDPECTLNTLVSEDQDRDYTPPANREVEVETERIDNIQQGGVDKAVKLRAQQPSFSTSDYKNGAVFAHYCWSQTLKDVELHVKLPVELQTAKKISIDIRHDSILVKSRLNPDTVLVAGKIWDKFKYNDALWTISEGKLVISFDKSKEMWWEKLFTSEESVNLQTLDCERYIDELPEESQAQIQKLRIQQMEQDSTQQRQINEINAARMEKFREAWEADDSPFKGQPFDPSVVHFS